MTREIKFRGKRLDNGEWLYGSLLISHFKDDEKERYFITQFSGNYTFEHEVDPATVGQFTGLKDKNGREIYEDDIFEHRGIFGCVVWDSQLLQFQCAWENFGFKTAGDISYLRNMGAVVLGNIYDNFELLKK